MTLSLTINETLKWLSSLLTLLQESFWWWQCSDRYIISLSPHLHTRPPPPFSPSLISCTVSVDVKHHVYGLSVLTSLMVSADLRQYWTMLTHWSQLVPNNYFSRHPRTHNSSGHEEPLLLPLPPIRPGESGTGKVWGTLWTQRTSQSGSAAGSDAKGSSG